MTRLIVVEKSMRIQDTKRCLHFNIIVLLIRLWVIMVLVNALNARDPPTYAMVLMVLSMDAITFQSVKEGEVIDGV
jgi:hypothetical protein